MYEDGAVGSAQLVIDGESKAYHGIVSVEYDEEHKLFRIRSQDSGHVLRKISPDEFNSVEELGEMIDIENQKELSRL